MLSGPGDLQSISGGYIREFTVATGQGWKRIPMANRDNCRYIAFLYENDRTHFDKPGCLKWHGSWPNKWDCPEDCKDYEEMKINDGNNQR